MNKAVIHINTFDFGWESRVYGNTVAQMAIHMCVVYSFKTVF